MNNAVNTNLKEGTDGLTGIAMAAFEITCAAKHFFKVCFCCF